MRNFSLESSPLRVTPSQFAQDWRDSRITFTAKTKTLPGKQGQVDDPTTILLFLISSSKTVAYLTSCFKVALTTLWLSFFFFWQFSMLVSGSQIAYIKHLVSPLPPGQKEMLVSYLETYPKLSIFPHMWLFTMHNNLSFRCPCRITFSFKNFLNYTFWTTTVIFHH